MFQVSTINVKTAKWLETNKKAELRGIGLKGGEGKGKEGDDMKKAPGVET